MKIKHTSAKGQISVALILMLTVILGAIGLGADAALLYFNWVILQKGVDAAALAGAGYLQGNSESAPNAISIAVTYAQNNNINSSELIADGSGNKAYVPAPNYTTITVTAERTVPYAFFKLIGLSNGKVAATATAQMPLSAGCVNCTSAIATPAPGSQPTPTAGNICSAVGQCDVLPIGLDSSTPYTFDQPVTLNFEQVGPGNWDNLALGGNGGSQLRTNIADGYQGPLAIGQWVSTEPGKAVGPVNQGFADRLKAADSEFPNDTADSHNPANPRVIIIPMVNWNSPNGKSEVQIVAFAALWVVSEKSGVIQADFIQQEAFESTGYASAPNDGALGRPILIK
ncbi:MAG: hypothetical protein WCA59_13600 [Candidatus Binataceae bacterium]